MFWNLVVIVNICVIIGFLILLVCGWLAIKYNHPLVLLFLSCAVCIGLICLDKYQSSFLFVPQPTSSFPVAHATYAHSCDQWVHNGIHSSNNNQEGPVIVFYHGNGACAAQGLLELEGLFGQSDKGCDLFVFEYPKYGSRFDQSYYSSKEDGELLFQEATQFGQQILSDPRFQHRSVIFMGHSLGSCVVSLVVKRLCMLLHVRLPDEMVLIAPFSSAKDVYNDFTLGLCGTMCSWKELDNVENLKWIRAREKKQQQQIIVITAVFAEDDFLLPVNLHEPRLKPYCDRVLTLPKVGHGEIFEPRFENFWSSLLMPIN